MYETYNVMKDDTIESIANKLNVSENLIYSLNNNVPEILPGMTLIVPKKSNSYFDYYKISKGDKLINIGKKYNTNASVLATLNGLELDDYIYPGQIIMVPKEGVKIYITAQGDTLQNIVTGMNGNLDKFLMENSNIYLMPEQLIIYK